MSENCFQKDKNMLLKFLSFCRNIEEIIQQLFSDREELKLVFQQGAIDLLNNEHFFLQKMQNFPKNLI